MDIKHVISEFREFTAKGNFFDLAVAFVAGTAFNKTIQSLVNDLILPPIGSLWHNIDFNNLFVSLNGKDYDTLAAAQAAGAPTVNYGVFLNSLVTLLVTVWAIFFIVRATNRFRRHDEQGDPSTRECPYCTKTIPIKATRCPECTSELDGAEIQLAK